MIPSRHVEEKINRVLTSLLSIFWWKLSIVLYIYLFIFWWKLSTVLWYYLYQWENGLHSKRTASMILSPNWMFYSKWHDWNRNIQLEEILTFHVHTLARGSYLYICRPYHFLISQIYPLLFPASCCWSFFGSFQFNLYIYIYILSSFSFIVHALRWRSKGHEPMLTEFILFNFFFW